MSTLRLPGYTLLELLIAITIFSALIIVSVAIFARTATTSAKSNISRQKTEAARSIVDQISNDFRYVDETVKPHDCPDIDSSHEWLGYCVDDTNQILYMLLKYPGDTSDTAKIYSFSSVITGGVINNNSQDIQVAEYRDCTNPIDCTAKNAQPATLLSTSYHLDNDLSVPVFKATPDTLDSSNPDPDKRASVYTKGNLSINLTIKLADFSSLCKDAAAGTCYQLTSTLVPGGFQ